MNYNSVWTFIFPSMANNTSWTMYADEIGAEIIHSYGWKSFHFVSHSIVSEVIVPGPLHSYIRYNDFIKVTAPPCPLWIIAKRVARKFLENHVSRSVPFILISIVKIQLAGRRVQRGRRWSNNMIIPNRKLAIWNIYSNWIQIVNWVTIRPIKTYFIRLITLCKNW